MLCGFEELPQQVSVIGSEALSRQQLFARNSQLFPGIIGIESLGWYLQWLPPQFSGEFQDPLLVGEGGPTCLVKFGDTTLDKGRTYWQ